MTQILPIGGLVPTLVSPSAQGRGGGGGFDFNSILALLLQQQQFQQSQSAQQAQLAQRDALMREELALNREQNQAQLALQDRQLAQQSQIAQQELDLNRDLKIQDFATKADQTLAARREKAKEITQQTIERDLASTFDRDVLSGVRESRVKLKAVRSGQDAAEKLKALSDSGLLSYVNGLPTDDSVKSLAKVNGVVAHLNELIEVETDPTVVKSLERLRDDVSGKYPGMILGETTDEMGIAFADRKDRELQSRLQGELERIDNQYLQGQAAVLSARSRKEAADQLSQWSNFKPLRRAQRAELAGYVPPRPEGVQPPSTLPDQVAARGGISSPVSPETLLSAQYGIGPRTSTLLRDPAQMRLGLGTPEDLLRLIGGYGAVGAQEIPSMVPKVPTSITVEDLLGSLHKRNFVSPYGQEMMGSFGG